MYAYCLSFTNKPLNKRRDGVVVGASAWQSVDLGFISLVESYQKTCKMVFTASLLGAQHKKENVENKPANLLDVFLGKALNGTPPSLCGKPSTRRHGPTQLKTSKKG